ncbi:uncharacterized protein BO80DRAFT_447106 [Aspergillus ibericus CBS 121593]|uniref:Uncharacterized protein n=1 Tax=Aspergillus ibericus CBS 121593 TaxID=1448316 RepID=A0A395GT25_9EURO|nr:hypothetical protein BO80DRAFT_447106 [Aspergillus ibericus CBS 121593]RAK98740.1 hypothetical protein BO80DRAFT_447106 [Aspergillus ibericus CBS 121593]
MSTNESSAVPPEALTHNPVLTKSEEPTISPTTPDESGAAPSEVRVTLMTREVDNLHIPADDDHDHRPEATENEKIISFDAPKLPDTELSEEATVAPVPEETEKTTMPGTFPVDSTSVPPEVPASPVAQEFDQPTTPPVDSANSTATDLPAGWTMHPVTLASDERRLQVVTNIGECDLAMYLTDDISLPPDTRIIRVQWAWLPEPDWEEECLRSLIRTFKKLRNAFPDLEPIYGMICDRGKGYRLFCEMVMTGVPDGSAAITPVDKVSSDSAPTGASMDNPPADKRVTVGQFAYNGRMIFDEDDDEEIMEQWCAAVPRNEYKGELESGVVCRPVGEELNLDEETVVEESY